MVVLNRQRGSTHFLGGALSEPTTSGIRFRMYSLIPESNLTLKACPLPTETKSMVLAIFDIVPELIPDVVFSSTCDDPAGKGSSTATSNAKNRYCHLASAWLLHWPIPHHGNPPWESIGHILRHAARNTPCRGEAPMLGLPGMGRRSPTRCPALSGTRGLARGRCRSGACRRADSLVRTVRHRTRFPRLRGSGAIVRFPHQM